MVDNRKVGASAGRFVGRAEELQRIEHCLALLANGIGNVVLVSGEAGIGKSRLAKELATRAVGRGYQIWTQRCSPFEINVPYLPMSRMLNDFMISSVNHGFTVPEALFRLFPERYPDAPRAHPQHGDLERQRIHDAVWDLMRACGENVPLVVVLDDLHWADKATLALLSFLGARVDSAPVLIVGLRRTSEAAIAESGAPLPLIPSGALRLRLQGLSLDDIRAFLDEARAMSDELFDDESAGDLLRLTGGNPLFMEEVVRHNHVPGKPASRRFAFESLEVPEALSDIVADRLDGLPLAHRQILGNAAVLGLQFDFDVLAELSEGPEELVIEALERSSAELLIVEGQSPGHDFEFRHELVQQVLYQTLSKPRRQKLHVRAAEALAVVHGSKDTHAGEMARHLQLAGRRGDAAKLADASLSAAMGAQQVFAYGEAVHHLNVALEAMESSGAALAIRAHTLDRIAGILYISGSPVEDGLGFAERALKLYEQMGERERVAQAHSRLMWQFSSYPENLDMHRARGQLEAAKEILGDGRDRIALGYFHIGRASAALWEVRTAEGLDASAAGLGVAARLGDDALWSSAAGVRGWHLSVNGRLKEGRTLLERAWHAADKNGHLIWAFRAAWYHGTLSYLMANPWEACRWLGRERARPHLGGALLQRRSLIERLGHALIAVGDLAEAENISNELGSDNLVQLHLHYRRGDWEQALEGWTQTRERILRAGDLLDEWLVNHRIAAVASVMGDTDVAQAVLVRSLDISSDGAPLLEVFTRLRLVQLVAPKSVTEAAEHLRRAEALLEADEDWGGMRGQLAMSRGALAKWRGDPRAAVDQFTDALACFEKLRIPWECAEVRLQLAILAGDEGADQLERAAAIHRFHGTERFWERRLSSVKAKPVPSASVPGGLSARELEVLSWLAKGMTNAEIARALTISPFTVARHVSAILEKTGIRSRAGAAAMAVSAGIVVIPK